MAKPKPQHGRNHSLEALNEFGSAFGETVKKDVAKGTIDSIFSQLFGDLGQSSSSPDSYLKSPDKPLTVKDPFTGEVSVFQSADHKGKGETKKYPEKAPKQERRPEAAMDTREITQVSERTSRMENREIHQRLQEILFELKRLVSTSKVLQNEFASVDVEQAPTQAGEYHINFFDWLLLTIRDARQKVENSGAWLATAKGKSGKKGGYWGMFKKHGTSFALSNERSASNSVA